eukprot:TRINITY_DN2433_c1_g1_i2.p1 TRINITY_DN2433_c1_g1~~TRINITY_DN2433_c1_g1_i2.p1  ORF type:complete len:455 (+),score=62.54 TRINITY_DN2433_c1_g1_i2:64-1365(+)
MASSSSDMPGARRVSMESMPVPSSFICPISHEIMNDPVLTVDGQGYDRASIEAWFRSCRGQVFTSPLTGVHLPSRELIDNFPLRHAIEQYLQWRPEIERKELDRLSLEEAAATLQEEMIAKAHASQNPQDPSLAVGLCNAVKHTDLNSQIIRSCAADAVNEVDEDGCTALHHAAARGLSSLCFEILEHPSFTEALRESLDGSTAVELALQHGHRRLAAAMDTYLNEFDLDLTAECASQRVATAAIATGAALSSEMVGAATLTTQVGGSAASTHTAVGRSVDDDKGKGKGRMAAMANYPTGTRGVGTASSSVLEAGVPSPQSRQQVKGSKGTGPTGDGKGEGKGKGHRPASIKDLLGQWRDSRGDRVEVIRHESRPGCARLLFLGRDRRSLVICRDRGAFVCSHYEVDCSQSNRMHVHWINLKPNSEGITWRRE